MASSLASILDLLAQARTARSGGGGGGGGGPLGRTTCMQLAFLISDGVISGGTEERERVRRHIAEAREAGVLVVLVIVDRAGARSEDSIVQRESVRFEGGRVCRTAYLEDYPFPYYIVMRDVNLLPDVLADAMRQWFALVVAA